MVWVMSSLNKEYKQNKKLSELFQEFEKTTSSNSENILRLKKLVTALVDTERYLEAKYYINILDELNYKNFNIEIYKIQIAISNFEMDSASQLINEFKSKKLKDSEIIQIHYLIIKYYHIYQEYDECFKQCLLMLKLIKKNLNNNFSIGRCNKWLSWYAKIVACCLEWYQKKIPLLEELMNELISLNKIIQINFKGTVSLSKKCRKFIEVIENR